MKFFQSQIDWYKSRDQQLKQFIAFSHKERSNRLQKSIDKQIATMSLGDYQHKSFWELKRRQVEDVFKVAQIPKPLVEIDIPKSAIKGELVNRLLSIKSKLIELRDTQ